MVQHDLIVRGATLPGRTRRYDIAVTAGRIASITPHVTQPGIAADRCVEEAEGRLVMPGFVDSHVHLDKSCLMGCACGGVGGLKGAIAAVSAAKRGFTSEDVYARGARTLEKAILKGTTHMRTHVEVDPRVGLVSFEAMLELKRRYAFAIDLSVCVFPQEGLTNDPGTEALLLRALDAGADLLGGCPYTDTDPQAQIERLFAIAVERDLDLDLHLDFDLDPHGALLFDICRQATRHAWQGRVAIGHVTKLSAMDEDGFLRAATALADAGVAVTALPATDLYLTGRDRRADIPRGIAPVHRLFAEHGVLASLATNNVLNPFTPFGDGSLLRMAQLYANAMHVRPEGFELCLDLVTRLPARLMRLETYGLEVGAAADFVILDAPDAISALAELPTVVAAYKRGRRTFRCDPARLDAPPEEGL
ncbi:amidohydrolase family protein [Aureimonas frigidaquae]|uniref:amidohydrolase family protein n=1 Tax=Aureimonas frigidaquae TaxID=424757 RepID=UPI0007861A69|nr:amidohydrolase family protein [Aureimonas frigidaquae]